MRHFLVIIIFFGGFSLNLAQAQKAQAYFDYKCFYNPQSGHYIETYLHFNSLTLTYASNDNEERANVHVVQTIIDADSNTVVKRDYVLPSPPAVEGLKEDFSDMQRFPLEPGSYLITVEITDMNNPKSQQASSHVPIKVKSYIGLPSISDIELLEAYVPSEEQTEYSKSGYILVPYILNYYPRDMDKIIYYTEIYNANLISPDEEYYAYKQYIYSLDHKSVVEESVRIKRKKVEDVTAILTHIPIDKLGSGNYELVIEVLDKDQMVSAQERVFFQRNNPELDLENIDLNDVLVNKKFVEEISKDSLPYFLESMVHITLYADRQTIYALLAENNEEKMRKFFQKFWMKTNPANPEEAWYSYKKQVLYVERNFGTQALKGFRTDRGRIYLQYGEPNSVVDMPNEPSSYPYQIWHYYKIGPFSNKKFVFYMPNLATNEYVVLHSNLQGERVNHRWQHDLNKRNSAWSNIDDPSDGNPLHWGGNSNIYFDNHY